MPDSENLEKSQEQIDLKQLKEKLSNIYEDLDKYDKLRKFIEKLRVKYEDCQDYQLYHFLIGSTPDRELSKIDFPGGDSIEKFINSLG